MEAIEKVNKNFADRLGYALCSVGCAWHALAGVAHHSLSPASCHLLCSQLGTVLSQANDQSLVWGIHQELSRRQRHTTKAKGTHHPVIVADNRLYSVVGDFAMAGTVDSVWHCCRRYGSSGEDKDR